MPVSKDSTATPTPGKRDDPGDEFSRLSDIGEDAKVKKQNKTKQISSRFIFALSQFSGPGYLGAGTAEA